MSNETVGHIGASSVHILDVVSLFGLFIKMYKSVFWSCSLLMSCFIP